MTMMAVKEAFNLRKQLYINRDLIEILFLDELTETIEIKFIDSGIKTFVTHSAISDKVSCDRYFTIDRFIVLRCGGC